jgi:hypothetical protein
MPLSKGFRERLLADVVEAAGQRHDAELAANRERRIRALAGSIAYYAWASSHLTEDLSPVLYGVCLDKAARIIDALDALPVPAKEEVRRANP